MLFVNQSGHYLPLCLLAEHLQRPRGKTSLQYEAKSLISGTVLEWLWFWPLKGVVYKRKVVIESRRINFLKIMSKFSANFKFKLVRTVCYTSQAEFTNAQVVEVSGLNLEVFCMDYLKHRKGLWFSIRFSSFLLWTAETIRGCVSLKKYRSQGKAVTVTVNSKEEDY
jgi:hypothetical protein